MGARGPQRKPGSVRWQREVRKQQKLSAIGASEKTRKSAPLKIAAIDTATLPTCPRWLSKPVAERWQHLVIDMAAAGVQLQQLDSRSIAIAAGYENDLADLETMCGNGKLEAEQRLSAIRLKNSTRKDYLAALMAIGGTPVVRLRARIAPEEKPKVQDDPWGNL